MTAAESAALYPLTSLQKSMVLASLRGPRSGAYILQDICELIEALDSELLESAWHRLAQRHAALRTSVSISAENNIQLRVHENPAISWRKLDWSGVAAGQKQDQLGVLAPGLGTWIQF